MSDEYIDVPGWGRLYFWLGNPKEEHLGRRGQTSGQLNEMDDDQLFPGRLNDSAGVSLAPFSSGEI